VAGSWAVIDVRTAVLGGERGYGPGREVSISFGWRRPAARRRPLLPGAIHSPDDAGRGLVLAGSGGAWREVRARAVGEAALREGDVGCHGGDGLGVSGSAAGRTWAKTA
jgi:hypothetical protein